MNHYLEVAVDGQWRDRGVGLAVQVQLGSDVMAGQDIAVEDDDRVVRLAAPLTIAHSANLPFSDRGTGLSFAPATRYPHSSNEPVQALGSGIVLDHPLKRRHAINVPVADAGVTTAGYQGTSAPNQWFGGPALSTGAGSMVLRDDRGLVADSLNYGLLVDPWAAEGYQAASGSGQSGCRVSTPAGGIFGGRIGRVVATNRSAGRFPDGADTDTGNVYWSCPELF